jgi:hypothetical protein
MSDPGQQYPYHPPGGPGSPMPPSPPPSYGPPPQPTYGPPSMPPSYGSPAGQPSYGPPPAQPSYGPPPGQPSYGPPPGQPSYGPPPPYGEVPYGGPPPTPNSRTSLWVAIAVVAVLVVGGGATAFVLLRNSNKPVVEHLSTPQRIGNFELAADPSGSLTQPNMTNDVRNEVTNPTGSIAALYLEAGDRSKPVVVVAATGTIADPDAKMTQLFHEAGSERIANVHDVDPGQLSGTGRCGSATEQGQTFGVCVWVDPGSIGAIIFINREAAESEGVFRQVRDAILKRD